MLSVVIPTRGRPAQLRRTLVALTQQSVDTAEYQVIIVVDGCEESASVAWSLPLPSHWRVLFNNVPGRASARNLGAAHADGDLLLFLDDDMEASPSLIHAHREAHERTQRTVVLGFFPMLGHPEESSAEAFVRAWWDDHFFHWRIPSHQFQFRDFCTGNVSIDRALFEEAGGFDKAFSTKTAGEDWELGYRIFRLGKCHFTFAEKAKATHHNFPTWSSIRCRACEEGRGHAMIVRKHPELLDQLPIRIFQRLSRNLLGRAGLRLLNHRSHVFDVFFRGLEKVQIGFEKLGMHAGVHLLHKLLAGYAYWQGIRSQMTAFTGWSFSPASVTTRAGAPEITL